MNLTEFVYDLVDVCFAKVREHEARVSLDVVKEQVNNV